MILVTFEQVVGTEDRSRTEVLPAVPRRGDLVDFPEREWFDPIGAVARVHPRMRGTVASVTWRGTLDGNGVAVPEVVLITAPVAG